MAHNTTTEEVLPFHFISHHALNNYQLTVEVLVLHPFPHLPQHWNDYLGEVFSKNRLCIFIDVIVDRISVTADSMACTDSTDCIWISCGADWN